MLNLRESLLSYQEYFEQLHKEKDSLCKKIKQAFAMKILEAGGGIQAVDNSSKEELEANLKEVELKFQSATDALVQSYDEHMKKIVPKPKLLPIRISVLIECKNHLRIENVHVKPYENLNGLLKIVEEL